MSQEMEDELFEDFLVETGETLEELSNHLVDLEQQPEDSDLLNKVFRGFHNIKGGAGFLNLTALVDVCHGAEDVFNVLRQGERTADSQLMDVILKSLDVVVAMVDEIGGGVEPTPADPALLAQLTALAVPAAAATAPAAASPAPTTPASSAAASPGDDVDAAFEELLGDLPDKDAAVETARPATDAATSDEISDDEFESLLDDLHGAGKFGAAAADSAVAEPTAPPPAAPPEVAKAADDEISDDEFEALLDSLHGEGQFGGATTSGDGQDTAAAAAEPAPAPGPDVTVAPVPTPAETSPPDAAPSPPPPAKAAAPKAAPRKSRVKEAAAAKGESTVRVDIDRLDNLMNMVGELVLVRNRLVTLEGAQSNEELSAAVGNLDVVTADLQVAVMKTRMQPIKKVFGRFPRVVRDLARSLNKDVKLEMRGEETDLDKNLVEALADPLVHLVRNSVDHGIEMPDVREAAGKPRAGKVVLTAEQEGEHILLTISDDGDGMDAEKLRQKVVEKGLLDEDTAARLDEQECYNLIFLPGFSTKTEISDVSGRGVGMDVVKTSITQLNGVVEITSKRGEGTKLSIKVPLTLAIMPTLMVMLSHQIYALPLLSIMEIVELDVARTKTIDGQLVVLLRDKALPLFHLREWLLKGEERYVRPDTGHIVVTTVGAERVGLVVDQLLGQEEVVIKALGALLQGTPGLAGATITGNGKIALIVDVAGLINGYAKDMVKVA